MSAALGANAPGRVLVTGSAGFIGRALVPALAAAGWQVRAAARDPSRVAAGPNVEAVALPDLGAPVDWRPLVADVTHIVHLAGIAHAMGAIPEDRYAAVNGRATAALAEAAAAVGAKLVFVSSVRAQSAAVAPGVLTEADPPRPTDAYGRSKLAAEDAVRTAGGRFVILRPVLVYGPGVAGNMGALLKLAATPWPLPFGAFANRRSLLALGTLVAATLWALEAQAAEGQTFLVADRTPIALCDLIAALRRGLGRSPNLVAVPPSLLLGALRLAGKGDAADRLGGELVVSTDRLAEAGFCWPADGERALSALMKT
ncbi:NAD-dependent epimerase/dehydratase family protein [Blastochloris tepida]|uniref:UDP-glucose 4-epimerase n=1 Tax=Blastochloris tepida TaxID=2233851 RepID=A0A348G3B4_9HYPH|nr:NAD-dependent epimerase/dehydratase family protein [Blastochloris tepida]BBF94047.1 UDP-glucose 4-epimerase [Blastochloris tepida]